MHSTLSGAYSPVTILIQNIMWKLNYNNTRQMVYNYKQLTTNSNLEKKKTVAKIIRCGSNVCDYPP